MEKITVQKRDLSVKPKKLRRLGMVPGSVFGKSLPESIYIQMEESVARKLIRQKREGSKLSLDIDGKTITVQIKEKTFDMLKDEIIDISFQALIADEKVNSVVHIFLANDEKIAGQLDRMLLEIPYASLPENMIDTITIDLDGMKTGTVLAVKDIPELMSGKLELQVDVEEIVLRISEKARHEVTPTEE